MIFKKEKKPFIKFVCSIPGFEAIEEIQPKPAVKYLPDWWKQIPIKNDGGYTSKICPSMSDYLSSGYVLPMWMDMTFEYSKYSQIWKSKHPPHGPFFPLAVHENTQFIDYADVNFIGKDASVVFKANSPWRIITPKGYSVLQLPLLYHFNKDFTVLPGIIDTDIHHEINVQMAYHGNEEIFIKRGTPLCVYIPFKRTKYNFSFSAETEKEKARFDFLLNSISSKFLGSGWYRSMQRERDKGLS